VPPGLTSLIQSFNNVMATMTNAFTPLLYADVILDAFSYLIFIRYTHMWIWVPALLLWILTAIVYFYFALKKPHLLSTTVIQRYGMQIEAKLGEKGKKPMDEATMLEIPPTTDPAPKNKELKDK
jgi:hypothetical protein